VSTTDPDSTYATKGGAERYAKLGRAHITKTGTTAKVIWIMMDRNKPEQEEGDKANIA
jgi:hypothetical protein